jgi:glucuronosyltransferase
VEALPQNDVLGHPSLAAFVTQGGYLSMAEAAYHGVPVVGVPLIIGEGDIVSAAVDQGRALLVSKSSLLRGDPGPLVAALQAVVSNSSYKAAAGVIARRLAAAPPPGEVAAQQVAYALQIRDQPPFLQTQGAGMPLYQVLMLDVVGVGVAGCVAVVAAGRWLWRRLWGGSTRLGGVVAKVKSA